MKDSQFFTAVFWYFVVFGPSSIGKFISRRCYVRLAFLTVLLSRFQPGGMSCLSENEESRIALLGQRFNLGHLLFLAHCSLIVRRAEATVKLRMPSLGGMERGEVPHCLAHLAVFN